jgi:hypothetical protein
MFRRVYRVNLVNSAPFYKTSLNAVRGWASRNPGEMQSFDEVDLIEELDRLSEALEEAEERVEKLQGDLAEANERETFFPE